MKYIATVFFFFGLWDPPAEEEKNTVELFSCKTKQKAD
jgi:hypothetical protein